MRSRSQTVGETVVEGSLLSAVNVVFNTADREAKALDKIKGLSEKSEMLFGVAIFYLLLLAMGGELYMREVESCWVVLIDRLIEGSLYRIRE